MTDKQKAAVLCAYLDLKGAEEAHEQGREHDWKAHSDSIADLRDAFPELLDTENPSGFDIDMDLSPVENLDMARAGFSPDSAGNKWDI